jgi:FKBP-type peptidyl-prolyl cis-trans isomerase FklB
MNIRLYLSALVAVLLSACTNNVTGQKEGMALKTNRDSVSYGLGTGMGHNIKESMRSAHLDSLNIDAFFGGVRDGYDSTDRITSEKVQAMVRSYMIEAQKKMMAEEAGKVEAETKKGEAWLTENGKRPGVITTPSGLQYEILQAGTGPKATLEDSVSANYRGTLIDGHEFDSSARYGGVVKFGMHQVIPGWTEAIQMMPTGSRWKLYVPPGLAYGSQGNGADIPGGTTLVFELEVVKVHPHK